MHESSESVATLRLGFAESWNRTSDLRITNAKVVYSTSEEGAVKIFQDFHKGSEIYSVKDTDQNGMNETY